MARRPTTNPPAGLPEDLVWRGIPDLVPNLVPVAGLVEDPANSNGHGEKSIRHIAGSYARFKQHKPIVIDQNGVVRAGNGQLRAALSLGWTHIAAVRTDLEGIELALYGIADNQTARPAELDFQTVALTLKEAEGAGLELTGLGWDPHELEPILLAEWKPPPSDGTDQSGGPAGDDDGPKMAPPIHVTADQWQTISAAVERVRELSQGVETSVGQALELVCGDFLAGQGIDDRTEAATPQEAAEDAEDEYEQAVRRTTGRAAVADPEPEPGEAG